MMTMTVELFWSFRSPYSYLAMQRYVDMTAQYDLHINLRPVYPLAIREPDFFERNHPNWLSYVVRDMTRAAQFHNIPIAFPNPDPIVQDMQTRKISENQPYIFRLTRLGQVAARRGKSLNFCHAVSFYIWGGTANWDKGDYLDIAAQSAQLNLAEMDQEAIDDAEALDKEIQDNQTALENSGHWGVPTLVVDGEPFFGQDRIDMALWRMQQLGIKER